MTHTPPPDIDRRLREAFAGDASSVARVVRGALSAGALPSGRLWTSVAAAAAVVVMASVLALWPSTPTLAPEPEPSASPFLSGSVTDGVLVVALPDGSTSISWGGARDDRPPDGSGIVLVEGELR